MVDDQERMVYARMTANIMECRVALNEMHAKGPTIQSVIWPSGRVGDVRHPRLFTFLIM